MCFSLSTYKHSVAYTHASFFIARSTWLKQRYLIHKKQESFRSTAGLTLQKERERENKSFFKAAREIVCKSQTGFTACWPLGYTYLIWHFCQLWKTDPNTTQCHCLSKGNLYEGNTDKKRSTAKAETELLPQEGCARDRWSKYTNPGDKPLWQARSPGMAGISLTQTLNCQQS